MFVGAGLAAASVLWHRRRVAMGLRRPQDFWLLVNVCALSVFLGGRLGYLALYAGPGYPLDAAVALDRGFTILGSLYGAAAGTWLFARAKGLPYLPVADGIFMGAPLWHAFGRLGCFSAGCCAGRPGLMLPLQLAEAAGELALAGVLWFLVRPRLDDGRLSPGSAAAAFFVGYGALRLALEPLRLSPLPGARWAALGLCAVGAAFAAGARLPRRARA